MSEPDYERAALVLNLVHPRLAHCVTHTTYAASGDDKMLKLLGLPEELHSYEMLRLAVKPLRSNEEWEAIHLGPGNPGWEKMLDEFFIAMGQEPPFVEFTS